MKRTNRSWTPEQKANIVNQIDTDRKQGLKLMEALGKHQIPANLYLKWKRKLEVGISASLRNGKSSQDIEKKQLVSEVKKLRQIVLSQSLAIAELKKEMNLEYLTI